MKTCAVDGCDRPAKTRGMCTAHYQRRLYGSRQPDAPIQTHSPTPQPCQVAGCEKTAICKGMCIMHYQRARRGQALDAPPLRTSRAGACATDGCTNPVYAKKLCRQHYNRARGAVRADAPLQASRDYVIEDVEWIIGTDRAVSVAHRVGYDRLDSLIQYLRRAGRSDLVQRLGDTE